MINFLKKKRCYLKISTKASNPKYCMNNKVIKNQKMKMSLTQQGRRVNNM